jgi:hypothetical protein
LLAGLTAIPIFLPHVGTAHTGSNFIQSKWGTDVLDGVDQDRTVDWRFVHNVPHNARDVIKRGSWEWNQVSGVPMSFNFQAEKPDYDELAFMTCDGDNQSNYWYQRNKVGWGSGDLDGSLAGVVHCEFYGHIDRLFQVKMKFNESKPWHLSETDPGINETDAWSVAAHEFGHFAGWYPHFGSSECPDPLGPNANQSETMCPEMARGTKYQRSLEFHDKHTFDNAYD